MDDDFGFFTGKSADINGDGKVDFYELDNFTDDCNKTMARFSSSDGKSRRSPSVHRFSDMKRSTLIIIYIISFIVCFLPLLGFAAGIGISPSGAIWLTVFFLAAWALFVCLSRKK